LLLIGPPALRDLFTVTQQRQFRSLRLNPMDVLWPSGPREQVVGYIYFRAVPFTIQSVWSQGMSLFNVGFVIFPDLTQLDFTGPQQVLALLPQSAMHIVAKSAAPVSSDSGLSLLPTHTFETCPQLDLICVPGGRAGVVQAMGDQETIAFVQRQSRTAKYVTSVCTGAFILGVAGLLKGRRATTHWAYAELLPLVGARYERLGSSRTAM
jgi:putative intracellular protease/amidase